MIYHHNKSIKELLTKIKIWIRSESDIFSGSYQENPHDMVSCTEATKGRLMNYYRKIQTERYDFHVRDERTVVLRSMVGRTTMRNQHIQTLYNLYAMPSSSGESLVSFLYRKRYLYFITKVNDHSPPNLFSSHACTCPEFSNMARASMSHLCWSQSVLFLFLPN